MKTEMELLCWSILFAGGECSSFWRALLLSNCKRKVNAWFNFSNISVYRIPTSKNTQLVHLKNYGKILGLNYITTPEQKWSIEYVLFVGSVVVANDYFKTLSAALRNLVGGRVVVHESLVDRGRREALLRMKEEAIGWGASQIVNVRFETSNIGGQGGGGLAAVEIMAYGTAIR